MRARRAVPALILILATFPGPLTGQSPDQRIRTALDEAAAAGVPTSLLESKVHEGRAKGLPTERIADAVERRLDRLASARTALANVSDLGPGDLSVGADALESGVGAAVLAELAGTAPRERRAAAIAALGDLVDADVAPREALDRVEDALTRGPGALQGLPAAVPGAGRPGVPADVSVPEDGVEPDGQPEGGGAPSDPPGGPPGR